MLKRYFNSDYIKNFSYLFGSSILSQAIPFLVLPILQKYFYTPEDFGLFTLYISITELLIGISTLKYEYAILVDNKLKHSVNTLFLSIIISAIISFIVFIVILILYNYSAENKLNKYLFLIPISVFTMAVYESINYWLNKHKQYLKIGVLKLTNSLTAECTKISFGFYKFNVNGLIAGRVIGQTITMTASVFLLYKNYKKYFRLYNLKLIKEQFKKHKRFPLYTAPGVIITGAINYLYISLFYEYYGPEKVGIIGISTSYIAAIFALVSASFSQVFFQKISEISDIKKIKSLYIKYSKVLALFSLFILSVTLLTPIKFIVYFLGDKWAGLLPVMQIMCAWLSVSFVTSSLSFIYIRLNKQKVMFILEIIHLIIVSGTIYLSHITYNNFNTTLICFSIIQIIYYLSVYLVSLSFMKKKI